MPRPPPVTTATLSLSMDGNTCLSALPVVCGRGEKEGRMRAEEAEKKLTKRIDVARAPAPLEEYVKHFDALFGKSNQRDGFRRYVEGLLLPSERHQWGAKNAWERV